MKKIIVSIASICIILSGTAYADGTPFTDTITWSGQTVFEAGFQYTHEVDFNVCAQGFCNVQLTLAHKGSNSYQNELWLVNDGDNTLIGQLGQSAGFILTETFNIGPEFYPNFPTQSWDFLVKIYDSNVNLSTNSVILYSSTLSGNYNCTPVPEPTTMLLLGLGLVGLAGLRRKI